MIEPIFEAEFLDNSHGFRPGRSVETACAQVEQNLSMGREWVVDVDIEKCYDTIPHEPLIDRVARRISDGRVLDLIRRFLQSGVMEEMEIRHETTGTPQGGIISPVLANIFLHDLDTVLEKRRHGVGSLCGRCRGALPEPGRSGTDAGNDPRDTGADWD